MTKAVIERLIADYMRYYALQLIYEAQDRLDEAEVFRDIGDVIYGYSYEYGFEDKLIEAQHKILDAHMQSEAGRKRAVQGFAN